MNTKKVVSNFFIHKHLQKFKMAAVNKKLSYFAHYRDNKISACNKSQYRCNIYIYI